MAQSHHCILHFQMKLPLEGRTWAIAECIEPGELEAVSSLSPLPPAVVTQHAHPSRNFVLVSTQGSYLISKQRPVDQLQHLLETSKGGCSDAIRAFFKLHRVRSLPLRLDQCGKLVVYEVVVVVIVVDL